MYYLLQTPDTLKAHLPAPFDAGVQSLDPSQTLPVSVLHSERKLMKVGDVKSMSWEQHVDIWKVCCSPCTSTSSGNQMRFWRNFCT